MALCGAPLAAARRRRRGGRSLAGRREHRGLRRDGVTHGEVDEQSVALPCHSRLRTGCSLDHDADLGLLHLGLRECCHERHWTRLLRSDLGLRSIGERCIAQAHHNRLLVRPHHLILHCRIRIDLDAVLIRLGVQLDAGHLMDRRSRSRAGSGFRGRSL